jgi:excisionase family DNA binding protein
MALKMSETDEFLGVPEAAVAAGVSQRTMWRWVRDGAVRSRRVGRRRLVRLRSSGASGIGEAAALYGPDEPYLPDPSAPIPWPFTRERLEERRRWLLEERRAAGAEMDRLAVPVERGYVERLIREVRDENRAWDGFMRYERAMKARARRRSR